MSFEIIQARGHEPAVWRWAAAVCVMRTVGCGGSGHLPRVVTDWTQQDPLVNTEQGPFHVLGSRVFQSISHTPDVTKGSFFETI